MLIYTYLQYLKFTWDTKSCDNIYLSNLVFFNKNKYNETLDKCVSQYNKSRGVTSYNKKLLKRLKYIISYMREKTDDYNHGFYDKLYSEIDKYVEEINKKIIENKKEHDKYIYLKLLYNKQLKEKAELIDNVYINSYKYIKETNNADKYKMKKFIRYASNNI